MRMIRHNMVGNLASLSGRDKRRLMLDETAKAIIVYPSALNQAIGNKGEPGKPVDVAKNICASMWDPRKAEKVGKVVSLVNRDGTAYESFAGTHNDGKGGVSMRSLMGKGGAFLKGRKQEIDAFTGELQQLLQDPNAVRELEETVQSYENFSGSGNKGKANTAMKIVFALATVGAIAGMIYMISQFKLSGNAGTTTI